MNEVGVTTLYCEYTIEEYVIREKSFYLPLGNETDIS